MKRQFRVTSHEEFDHIIHAGKSVRSSHYKVCFEPNGGAARIGIAVSKKNGGAITRVLIKRQIRAMLAQRNEYDLPMNVIIVVRPNYDTDLYQDNQKELNEVLDRIKEKNIE